MKEYVFKPGDRIIWVKNMSRTNQKDIPATFIKYAGTLMCIQPDRESPEDILPKRVNVVKRRIYLAGDK